MEISRPEDISAKSTVKILVIDDDENTLWLVSTLLQHNDFEVIKSASATEGLEIARDQQLTRVVLIAVGVRAVDHQHRPEAGFL